MQLYGDNISAANRYKKVIYRKQIARQHSCHLTLGRMRMDPVKLSSHYVRLPCKIMLLRVIPYGNI